MENKSVARGMFYGGFASCVAETITMPVDVVKTRRAHAREPRVPTRARCAARATARRSRALRTHAPGRARRLQMDGGGGAARMYTGSLDCAAKLTAGEGVGALFKGLPPALVRQSTYGSMRYGFYSPLRDMLGIEPGKPVPLWKKIVAGAGSGAIASALANPTDLVKVRMQTDGMNKGPDGKFLPKKYTGMVNCFLTTVREEGVMGARRHDRAPLLARAHARAVSPDLAAPRACAAPCAYAAPPTRAPHGSPGCCALHSALEGRGADGRARDGARGG